MRITILLLKVMKWTAVAIFSAALLWFGYKYAIL
jgi:hypothetical protein